MNMMDMQDSMLKLRGLTRAKVRELMEDLERAGSIKQVTGILKGTTIHGWTATENGVSYWLGTRTVIPARIAVVASSMDVARQLGGLNR